jgi:uncharacterized membrane protein
MIETLVIILLAVLAFTMRKRLREIETRMAALEARLTGKAPAAEAAPPEPFSWTDAVASEPTPVAVAPQTPVESISEEPEPALADAAASATPPPPPPPPPTAAPSQGGPSFEEQLGTRWVVWVGGIALALGAVFLVRYSIEQGLIGPGVRVTLGALLALALIGTGEWMRRQDQQVQIVGVPTAHIPSILTAAGTVAAYATVYAAYALYGFLNPAAAFVLLGIVALATLAAALLHGPGLAALGIVASYATPALVASDKPDYWALYIYLAIVTAAAFGLARYRLWRWLAATAMVLAVLWMLPGIDEADYLAPHVFHGVAGFALVAALIVAGLLYGPDAEPGVIDALSSCAVAAFLLAVTLLVLNSRHDTAALAAFTLLTAATVAIAWRTEAATSAVPAAAVMTLLVFADWAVDIPLETLVAPGGATAGLPPEPAKGLYEAHLVLGAGFVILFGGAGFFAQGRSPRPVVPILWAATATFAPIAILIALYYRVAGFERSLPFAGIALLLAAVFAVATETITRREPRPGSASAAALFAVGSIASLALTLTFALEKGWLTVSLALMVPGIAWVAERRPVPFLRWIAAAVVVLVLARIAWEPRIVGRDVGTTPIFNWLLWGYGVPALSFWGAGYMLRKRADDLPSRMVDSAAILFTVLLAFLQIRHYVNGGDVYRPAASVLELALQVSVGFAMAIGLERVRGRTGSVVHNVGAMIVFGLTLIGVAAELAQVVGPRFNNNPLGGLFFNYILLAYGLPAVLAITLALVARTTRPMPYRAVAAATAVILTLFYLTLEVQRFYRGPVLWATPLTDAEAYTYSAVWLVYGILLLAVGMLLRSMPARIAAGAVIGLTVAKVFLVDMSNLEGIWRALSFIGLGVVLVGIGYVYQRLLFPRSAPPAPTPPSTGTPDLPPAAAG